VTHKHECFIIQGDDDNSFVRTFQMSQGLYWPVFAGFTEAKRLPSKVAAVAFVRQFTYPEQSQFSPQDFKNSAFGIDRRLNVCYTPFFS
jgi:hypothetical protein